MRGTEWINVFSDGEIFVFSFSPRSVLAVNVRVSGGVLQQWWAGGQ